MSWGASWGTPECSRGGVLEGPGGVLGGAWELLGSPGAVLEGAARGGCAGGWSQGPGDWIQGAPMGLRKWIQCPGGWNQCPGGFGIRAREAGIRAQGAPMEIEKVMDARIFGLS